MGHFLIIAPGRSGSTSLRLTVNTANGTMCHGEVLGENRVLGPSGKLPEDAPKPTVDLRRDNPEAFLDVLFGTPGFDHHGFKALYAHFFLDQNQSYLDWSLAQGPKVLFLWRQNLVRRYLSECRKRMFERKPRPQRFARLSVEDITTNALLQIRMAQTIRTRLAAAGGVTVHDIAFEAMIADEAETHRAMDFLGLADSGYTIRKDERTAKNEASGPPAPAPDSFSAPEVEPFTNVTIEQALAWDLPE